MSKWFRIYDEALNDPKIQKLAPHLFKAWFNILCLANKAGNGVLPPVSDIAYALRVSDTDAQCIVDELILVGLIDIGQDKSLTPHNWSVRQAPSDSSKVRTKKWREGKKEKSANRHRDGDVTACDGKSDGPDQTRQDSDKNLVPSTSSVAAREKPKAKEQGFKIDLKGSKGKADQISTLTKRAEGLGLPVEEITQITEKANPDNHAAYFTALCVKHLRQQLPKLPEAMLRDALWGKSDAAYTAVTGALVMLEDAR